MSHELERLKSELQDERVRREKAEADLTAYILYFKERTENYVREVVRKMIENGEIPC